MTIAEGASFIDALTAIMLLYLHKGFLYGLRFISFTKTTFVVLFLATTFNSMLKRNNNNTNIHSGATLIT